MSRLESGSTEAPASGSSPIDLHKLAYEELGETQQLKRDKVQELRNLINGEPDLRCPSDDAFLVKFLRARKYSVEEAFSTIRKYFRVRKLHRDIFEDLRPSRVMFDAVFRRNKLAVVLDERDHLGRLVAILKFGAWKPDVCDVIDLFRIGVLGADYYLLDETTQIAGIVGILDLEGLSLKHFRHYTPSAVKKLIQLAQDSYPMRIKGIYVINNPAIFEIIYRFAKLFLKQKIINRTHFIGRD
ncbi:alpha-tocopherol transfer protein-like [Ixodes scapularis]|nr:alpha-tocopherol transfer protein-like [Ixodes scapularis]